MLKKTLMALAVGGLVITGATGDAAAKTLKVQASSKAGDWAHRFMTDTWAPKLDAMTAGTVSSSRGTRASSHWWLPWIRRVAPFSSVKSVNAQNAVLQALRSLG